MEYGLDLRTMPQYFISGYKVFEAGERHISRICGEDVLILMLEGVLHFYEDGKRVDLEKGEYYIQRRGILQEGRVPSDTARYYYIHFMGEYRQGEETLPLRGRGDFAGMRPIFQTLDLLQLSGRNMVEKTAWFYRILCGISEKAQKTRRNRVVTQIMTMIQEDIQYPHTLQEMAEYSGYSKNTIITFFRQETGQTPFEFVQKARLEAAKRLLANSDLPVGVIAEKVGFSGYVNFYKSFVKQEQVSPGEWRKKGNWKKE